MTPELEGTRRRNPEDAGSHLYSFSRALDKQTNNNNKKKTKNNPEGEKKSVLLNLLASGQLIFSKENSYHTNIMVTTLSVL